MNNSKWIHCQQVYKILYIQEKTAVLQMQLHKTARTLHYEKYLLPQIISDTILISGAPTSNGSRDQIPEPLGSDLSFITGHHEANRDRRSVV
jgi:hypothetical protein